MKLYRCMGNILRSLERYMCLYESPFYWHSLSSVIHDSSLRHSQTECNFVEKYLRKYDSNDSILMLQ